MEPHPDDVRLGQSLRVLRRRAAIRQVDLAAAAGVSRRTVGRIELGDAAELTIATVREVLSAADARLRVTATWNGASLDRLLDERHAALVERALRHLRRYGWRTEVEVTFSEYGERGSIDILAGHDATRTALIAEVKSAIGSIEETNRVLDVKVRLAPNVILQRFEWRAATVSRVLIVPEGSTVRRVIAAHEVTLASAYPARGRAVRRWLRRPEGQLRGIWFLSEGHHRASIT
jgi:transcriptional regulator with XRE-family HTH domain